MVIFLANIFINFCPGFESRCHSHESLVEWRKATGQSRSHAAVLICRKHDGEGQSGQAIKLFQIIHYFNDFQTLNNPGS